MSICQDKELWYFYNCPIIITIVQPHTDGPAFNPLISTISLGGSTFLDFYTPLVEVCFLQVKTFKCVFRDLLARISLSATLDRCFCNREVWYLSMIMRTGLSSSLNFNDSQLLVCFMEFEKSKATKSQRKSLIVQQSCKPERKFHAKRESH